MPQSIRNKVDRHQLSTAYFFWAKPLVIIPGPNPSNVTHVTKSDVFKTSPDEANMGRIYLVLMAVVILRNLEVIGRLKVWSGRGLKMAPLSKKLTPAIHRELLWAKTTFYKTRSVDDARSVDLVKTSVYSEFGTNRPNVTLLTWHMWQKTYVSKTCPDRANMGSVLMPVVILKSLVMTCRLEVNTGKILYVELLALKLQYKSIIILNINSP